MVFFFFQAEDGIRDYKVTGVQTCALPIWRLRLKQENRDKVLVFVADTYGIFHLAVLAGMRLTVVPHHPDRKSTRLNSSHLVISYAVFCLKKKKKYTH